MKKFNRTWSHTLISTAILAALPNVSAGQERETLVLEEVLVVATKRESNLQDVPVAVSALSDSLLQDNQIVQTSELSNLVASLNVQAGNNPSNSSFNIRGIGTQSFSAGAEPSVSTMVDGVVLGRSGMAFAQLPDVQRVEVLRGPQGTLFGKNASGGLIHIITKDPTQDFEGQVNVMADEHDEYRVAGTISGGITDSLAVRLTASYIDADGWIENVYDGNDYNSRDDKMIRGKLRWDASDSLFLKYTYDWQDNEHDGILRPLRVANEPSATALLPVVASDKNDKSNTSTDQIGSTDIDSQGHTLDVEWEIGEFTLTSITAYREWEKDRELPGIGSLPEDPIGLNQPNSEDQDQFTQELRITSPADAALTYVAGLYYFTQSIDTKAARILTHFNLDGKADYSVDSDNYAAFGEATYHLSDTLRLIAGARYTNDELDYTFAREGFPPRLVVDPPAKDDVSKDNVSGKAVIQWDFSYDAMTYLGFTQGYKGPAYSLTFGTDLSNLDAVDAEESDAWEWGIKSNLLDDSMSLNVAVFYTEYDNFQAQSFVDSGLDDGTGEYRLDNAGQVATQGVEADISWRATARLLLNGSLAYIDAEIDDYPEGPCTFGQQDAPNPASCAPPPEGNTSQDLSGGDLPHSPDWRATVSANYLIPLHSMPFDLVLKGNARWQDDVLFTMAQDKGTIQDDYAIVDMSLSLQDKDDSYTATVYVKNVTDEFYVTSILSSNSISVPGGGYTHQVPKYAERTVGVDVRYRW